jgi:hypothetical protein
MILHGYNNSGTVQLGCLPKQPIKIIRDDAPFEWPNLYWIHNENSTKIYCISQFEDLNHEVANQISSRKSKSQLDRASSATSHSVDRENNKILMTCHIKCLANLMGDVMIYTSQVLPPDGVIQTIGFNIVHVSRFDFPKLNYSSIIPVTITTISEKLHLLQNNSGSLDNPSLL